MDAGAGAVSQRGVSATLAVCCPAHAGEEAPTSGYARFVERQPAAWRQR